MSYPRCVESVSIRILWLRSTYWHSRLANATVASERSIFSKNHDYNTYIYKRVFRVAVNTYIPIFRGLQTCDGEYTKHCTRSRHQLKMATPAEVSKRRSNFRIRQFYEKLHYNIAANLSFNTMVSFVTLLIASTARISCA